MRDSYADYIPEEGGVLEEDEVVSDAVGLAHPQGEGVQALQRGVVAAHNVVIIKTLYTIRRGQEDGKLRLNWEL